MWYIHHVPVHCVPVHVTPRPNEVTHSKCWGVLTHSPTPIKNTSILRQNLLHVKPPSKPRRDWPEPIFCIPELSLKYKYKDHARELSEKRAHKSALSRDQKLPQRQNRNSNTQHHINTSKNIKKHNYLHDEIFINLSSL